MSTEIPDSKKKILITTSENYVNPVGAVFEKDKKIILTQGASRIVMDHSILNQLILEGFIYGAIDEDTIR